MSGDLTPSMEIEKFLKVIDWLSCRSEKSNLPSVDRVFVLSQM